ncbi:hypothetical protein JAAARDRAFT_198035 [Jaapia argillacea MUCL 33604]|uniref:T6SS Phospholipase effector Tle1-like catalytic domain-containing protein n=1 Tax=Jaapia argillacea MUCL 33604 TaxID=933084 RepID=A0A067PN07_9AGAM|nr:hypothetical protein JAAARDRAFT_198035 [Jaapia argillacea MUCL 33604]
MSTPLPPKKRILVFCDGTSADGRRGILSSGLTGDGITNVLRLSRAVKTFGIDKTTGQPIHQIVSYHIGVGAESRFNGEFSPYTLAELAFGFEVASKIRDAYGFIADNYNEGDEIFLFGWSRGAYTVRKVSEIISRIGLLSKDDMGLFPQYWAALNNPNIPWSVVPPAPTIPIPIECIGVFDTVGSVDPLKPVVNALGLRDNHLLPNVKLALHALALHENRDNFMCTLWERGPIEPTDPVLNHIWKTQVLKQVWFSGNHTDVGGGYMNHEKSDLVLFWMAGEIDQIVDLDHDFLKRCATRDPTKPWGRYPPTNSIRSVEGLLSLSETRLAMVSDAKHTFHESTLKWPDATPLDPSSMLTLRDLKQKFGEDWTPPVQPMNTFENECREGWGKTGGLVPVFESEVTFALVLNVLKNNLQPVSNGDVLLVPQYRPRARYTRIRIRWRDSMLEEEGDYYVLIAKNKSSDDADVVLFVQEEWFGEDKGYGEHFNKVARIIKGHYEFPVDSRCQYGQSSEGVMRFVVYHDKTRTPKERDFVDTDVLLPEIKNMLAVLGKGVIGAFEIARGFMGERLTTF